MHEDFIEIFCLRSLDSHVCNGRMAVFASYFSVAKATPDHENI